MIKTTIIIPTYNRSNFIKIGLKFFKKFNIKANIIICDGSSTNSQKQLNLKYIKASKLNNITYLYSKITPFERIYNSLKLIKTDYCKISFDDDFFSNNFINQGEKFLNSDKNISAINGSIFEQIFRRPNIKNGEVYPSTIKGENLISMNYLERVFLTSTQKGYLYNLYRTKDLKLIFRIISKIATNIGDYSIIKNQQILWSLTELLIQVYPILCGKIIGIKQIMLFRISHDKQWGSNYSNQQKFKKLWYDSFIYKKKYSYFQIISQMISKELNIKQSKVFEVLCLLEIKDLNKRFHSFQKIFTNNEFNKGKSFIFIIFNLSIFIFVNKLLFFFYKKLLFFNREILIFKKFFKKEMI